MAASKPKKTKSKKPKFIQDAIKKPGQLHRDLGVPQGKPIPKSKIAEAAKKPGKVGARARLAQTLNKTNKKKKATKSSKTRGSTKRR